MHARSLTSVLMFVAPMLLAGPALADDQLYHVTGKDSFQIGTRDLRGEILYDGQQTLTISRRGKSTRYAARVAYTRIDQGAAAKASGSFVSILLPDGEQRDESNGDPDFLTILNQPFAVQLDAQTLHDVVRLQQAAPFSFASPMSHGVLHGALRHATDGLVAGERVIGISFDARGPMRGAVPEHPEILLSGTIQMSGTAYYTEKAALLLALEATLTISGSLADRSVTDPVTIVYKRNIRAEEPAGPQEGFSKSTRARKKARPREVA